MVNLVLLIDHIEAEIVSSLRKSGLTGLDTARLAGITGLPHDQLSRYLTGLEGEGLIAHIKGSTYRLSDELRSELDGAAPDCEPISSTVAALPATMRI